MESREAMNEEEKPLEGDPEPAPPASAGADADEASAPEAPETDAEAQAEALESAPESEEDPVPRIAELESELAALTDRMLRAAAEAENVRRRGERERADVRKFAVQTFAGDVLAVADNLQRALDAVPVEERGNEAVAGLVEGVELTRKEFASVLERHGVKPVEALGRRFDPNLHQAMFEVESADDEAGTVVQVLRGGYTIHERLLRAAMVGVAKAPAVREDDS